MMDNAVRDYLTSLVRTWVPIGWGALLAWLVGRGVIDADTAAASGPTGVQIGMLLAVCAGWLFYAAARGIEPLLTRSAPGRLLMRVLIGVLTTPRYETEARRP